MALENSRLVKGLIYINPAMFGRKLVETSQTDNRFEDLKSEAYIAEIFANFQASGFIRLGEQLGIATSEEDYFKDYANFTTLSADSKSSLFASLRSYMYFSAQVRENDEYLVGDFARENVNKDIYKKLIRKPIIVVDGSLSGIEPVLDWFPTEQFLQFSAANVLTIKDASYKSLVSSDSRYMKIAAEFINDKISLM